MAGKPVVTETDNSKVTRQDLYYEITPSEIPGQWYVRLHYQEYGYYEYKRGWLFKTKKKKPFYKQKVQHFCYSHDSEMELTFASIPEAKRYITHLQTKPEQVWIDA